MAIFAFSIAPAACNGPDGQPDGDSSANATTDDNSSTGGEGVPVPRYLATPWGDVAVGETAVYRTARVAEGERWVVTAIEGTNVTIEKTWAVDDGFGGEESASETVVVDMAAADGWWRIPIAELGVLADSSYEQAGTYSIYTAKLADGRTLEISADGRAPFDGVARELGADGTPTRELIAIGLPAASSSDPAAAD